MDRLWKWTSDMCLMWLKDELKLEWDEVVPFVNVNGEHLVCLDDKQAMASQYSQRVSRRNQMWISSKIKELNDQAEKLNIVGDDYDNIVNADKDTLAAAPRQPGNLVGILRKSGDRPV